jgi:hypothetical protein
MRRGGQDIGEEIQGRADHRDAEGGRGLELSRPKDRGDLPRVWSLGEHLLPVAQGARGSEGIPGQADEGVGEGEQPIKEGGL